VEYKHDQPSIDFIIGGAEMTAGNAPEQLRPALAAIEDDIRRKLAGIKDEKTGLPPKVLMQGKDVQTLSFTITGSKAVIEEAQRRLGG
jgi:hypothetical protein